MEHEAYRPYIEVQPPARKGSAIACDSKRGITVLFGGGGLNDTWAWDGTNWTMLQPAVSPPARTNGSMAYDVQHERIVLFGGVSSSGHLLNDTWLWDGTNWMQQQVSDEPEPRCGAAMAYDQAHQKVVLYGGQTLNGRCGEVLGDTWVWDGTRWQSVEPGLAPQARLGACMAYDEARQQVVLFGGTSGNILFNDTWAWDGAQWLPQTASTVPPARAWASMIYSRISQQVVLLGGGSAVVQVESAGLGDAWSWNGIDWHMLNTNAVPAGGYQSAAFDDARQAIVLYATTGGKPNPGTKQQSNWQPNVSLQPTLNSETWVLHI